MMADLLAYYQALVGVHAVGGSRLHNGSSLSLCSCFEEDLEISLHNQIIKNAKERKLPCSCSRYNACSE